MKKIMILIAAISITSTVLYGCGGKKTAVPTTSGGGQDVEVAERSGETIKFTVTSDSPKRAEYCQLFVDYVAGASEKRYVGEVLVASSLGFTADTARMIQMDTSDFNLNDDMPIDGILDGKLGFAWLPGLISDYDKADQYYNEGWVTDQVAKIMEENNIIRISSFCNGFR